MKNLSLPIGAGILLATGLAIQPAAGGSDRMPTLDGALEWINSPPLSTQSLRGKVVLVNFWTYSCINSLRELPYIKAWAAKYRDAGLVVIGVHSPEFGFEKLNTNVRNAVADLKITFPVPIDSGHTIWQAFNNEYWPADYIIDAKGRIRYPHFGEGDYEKSERVIQALLRENGVTNFDASLAEISASGAEAPPSADVRSPETYVGYARAENFASPHGITHDVARTYSLPERPALNQWGFDGAWTVHAESATLDSPGGKIVFRFHSRDLHMVLGPAINGNPVRFRVRLNGAAPEADRGWDVGPDGSGEIRKPRMYQLIRQTGPVRETLFQIEFLDAGAEAFSFTFG